jgi:hypothetical protein
MKGKGKRKKAKGKKGLAILNTRATRLKAKLVSAKSALGTK